MRPCSAENTKRQKEIYGKSESLTATFAVVKLTVKIRLFKKNLQWQNEESTLSSQFLTKTPEITSKLSIYLLFEIDKQTSHLIQTACITVPSSCEKEKL